MSFTRVSDSVEPNPTTPGKVVTLIATASVTAKKVVQLDNAQSGGYRFSSCKEAATAATGNPMACGVALNSASAGERVSVQVAGYVTAVDSVSLSNGTVCVVDAVAGRAEAYVPADHNVPPLAIALGATSSNLTDLYLLNPMGL